MDDPAARLLKKVREFADTLDDDERKVLAILIAPGVGRAYRHGKEEVSGIERDADEAEWAPTALAESLTTALRKDGVRLGGS